MPQCHLCTPDSTASLYYEIHHCASKSAHNPPIMLIAGLGSDSQSWQAVLGSLLATRDVILLDNRGSGRTEASAGVTLQQMALDCLHVADYLDIVTFDVAGHSMGGMIAQELARMATDRIQRLVLCNTTAKQSARNEQLFDDFAGALRDSGATARWYRNLFYWLLTPDFFNSPQALSQLVNLVLAYPYASNAMAYQAQVDAMRGFDSRDWLAEITTETLVIASGADLLFPPGKDGCGLVALPNVTLVHMAEQAHSLPLEAPRVFCDTVLSFLGHPR